jgi:AraC-like DNA-binding protein
MSSVVAAWVSALVSYAEQRGAHRAALLEAAQLDDELLSDPDQRITPAQSDALWAAVDEKLKDANLGLHFGESLKSARPFGVMGYLSRAAETWGDALVLVQRYHPLLGMVKARFDRDTSGATFSIETATTVHGSLRQATEAAVTSMVVMARRATGKPLDPIEVRFRHPRPADVKEHERIFRCPVVFGAEIDAFDYEAASLATPLLVRDKQVERYLEGLANAKLKKVQIPVGVAEQTAQAVERALPKGSPSLSQVGKQLGLSARTLQRRLKEEGTSFAAVIDGVRKRLALEWVDSGRLTLSEVGYKLGFADPSAFRRAFHRWTGKSPRQARRK